MEYEDLFAILAQYSEKTKEEIKELPPEEFAKQVIMYVNTLKSQNKEKIISELHKFTSQENKPNLEEITKHINKLDSETKEKILREFCKDRIHIVPAAIITAGIMAISCVGTYLGTSLIIEKAAKKQISTKADSIDSKVRVEYIPHIEENPAYGYDFDSRGRLVVWSKSQEGPGKNPVHTMATVEEDAVGLYKQLENKELLPCADPIKRAKFIESLKDDTGLITKTKLQERLKKYEQK